MWGKKASAEGKVHIMTNAVDTDSFQFSNVLRIQKNKKNFKLQVSLLLVLLDDFQNRKTIRFCFLPIKR